MCTKYWLNVLNRLMSPVVLNVLKQPGCTGKAVKYIMVNWNAAGNVRVSTMINHAQ